MIREAADRGSLSRFTAGAGLKLAETVFGALVVMKFVKSPS